MTTEHVQAMTRRSALSGMMLASVGAAGAAAQQPVNLPVQQAATIINTQLVPLAPNIYAYLQREAPEILALDLADQHHERGRVVIGRMQRHHRVRKAGAARHDRDAGAVAQPAVGHRHVAGAAFVPADDDADRVALDEGAGQPDIAFAGDAVDLVDFMRFEAFRQEAGDGPAHLRRIPWLRVATGFGRAARDTATAWHGAIDWPPCRGRAIWAS